MFSNFRQLHQVMKDHSKSTRMRAVAAAVGEEVGFDEFDLKGASPCGWYGGGWYGCTW